MFFRIVLGIDAVVAVIAIYFFLSGLARGSVSSFNMGIWMALLAAIAAVIGGGVALRAAGRPGWGAALLSVLAVPALLYGLFMLLVIILQPRWN